MSPGTTPSVARQLGSLFDGGSVAGLSDRQLLERFRDRRDATGEAAFAALVARHGPMVLNVCRQLLGDRHHAEDAFQAVFLVLARKARSIRDPDLLGNWLYGVALRTARKAHARHTRRRKHEEGDAMRHPDALVEPKTEAPVLAREQAEILHQEIDRLPGPFRLAVVLCYLEGLTLDEAARRLQCPAGTVRSRLARACDKLRRGLTRRGVALPAVGLAAALSPRSAAASVSSPLCDMTARAAMNFAAGHAAAPAATALAREVLRSMLIHKVKLTVFALLFLGAVASGAGSLTHSLSALAASREGEPPGEPLPGPARAGPRPPEPTQSPSAIANDAPRPAPGRMFVTGRVLDPMGKPVVNTSVMVYARLKQFAQPILFDFQGPVDVDAGRCDASGRFRIDAARTSSSRHDQLAVIALAPGHAVNWVDLDPDAEEPTAEIALPPEQVIRGRLFDVQGRPARGVAIAVDSFSRVIRGQLDGPLFRPDRSGPFRADLLAWPGLATSDDDGRFTLRGLGRGMMTLVEVDDPRLALPITLIQTDDTASPQELGFGRRLTVIKVEPGADPKPLTIALQPARTITGRVTYADTGRPVPNAPLRVGNRVQLAQADAEGRFACTTAPSYDGLDFVTAQAPGGQPYLNVTKRLEWPKGAIQQSVDLTLPRGIAVRGKVTEEGTGKPIAGAIVRFTPKLPERDSSLDRGSPPPSATGADGAFQLSAPARPGYVVVQGPSDDYVLREFGAEGGVYFAQPGSRRFYAHAYQFLDLKPGPTSKGLSLSLRPGATIAGRVLGPDGQPVREAWIFSRVILHEVPSGGWKIWRVIYGRGRGEARDGGFALHGLDPDEDVPTYFIE
jgi:RNA polymerase sigma factor (sigma-70 family)